MKKPESYYELFQLQMYGDILEKRYEPEEDENGKMKRDDDDRWTSEQEEQMLFDLEN